MADTGADNWEQRTYLPIYDEAHWYADGEKHTLPDDFYSSEYFIDKTIEFISANESDDKPFFAYIPFQAVHMPVQAPREFSDKYAGIYDRRCQHIYLKIPWVPALACGQLGREYKQKTVYRPTHSH